MQIGHSQLTPEERKSISTKSLFICGTAMIDSGAAGNFMDSNFTDEHHIPLLSCNSPLTVTAIDGCPLSDGRIHCATPTLLLRTGSLHCESINFFIISSPRHSLILGLPWLKKHNPVISCREGEIISWNELCMQECLQVIANSNQRSHDPGKTQTESEHSSCLC